VIRPTLSGEETIEEEELYNALSPIAPSVVQLNIYYSVEFDALPPMPALRVLRIDHEGGGTSADVSGLTQLTELAGTSGDGKCLVSLCLCLSRDLLAFPYPSLSFLSLSSLSLFSLSLFPSSLSLSVSLSSRSLCLSLCLSSVMLFLVSFKGLDRLPHLKDLEIRMSVSSVLRQLTSLYRV
jgi:hypothetical protein